MAHLQKPADGQGQRNNFIGNIRLGFGPSGGFTGLIRFAGVISESVTVAGISEAFVRVLEE